VIDNFVNGKSENLADLDPQRLNVARVDVRDLDRVTPLFGSANLVLHLALPWRAPFAACAAGEPRGQRDGDAEAAGDGA
jgi:hypothetical protein